MVHAKRFFARRAFVWTELHDSASTYTDALLAFASEVEAMSKTKKNELDEAIKRYAAANAEKKSITEEVKDIGDEIKELMGEAAIETYEVNGIRIGSVPDITVAHRKLWLHAMEVPTLYLLEADNAANDTTGTSVEELRRHGDDVPAYAVIEDNITGLCVVHEHVVNIMIDTVESLLIERVTLLAIGEAFSIQSLHLCRSINLDTTYRAAPAHTLTVCKEAIAW